MLLRLVILCWGLSMQSAIAQDALPFGGRGFAVTELILGHDRAGVVGGIGDIGPKSIKNVIRVERTYGRSREKRRLFWADLDNDGPTPLSELTTLISTEPVGRRARRLRNQRAVGKKRHTIVDWRELRVHTDVRAADALAMGVRTPDKVENMRPVLPLDPGGDSFGDVYEIISTVLAFREDAGLQPPGATRSKALRDCNC